MGALIIITAIIAGLIINPVVTLLVLILLALISD